MSLITEDGTGLANAESFCSVVAATAYFAGRNAAWAAIATDALREQYLRQATDYMEQAYRDRWAGFRRTLNQVLCWPRAWVPLIDAPSGYSTFPSYYDPNSVPPVVANACALLALRVSALTGGATLLDDLGQGVESEQIGPLRTVYNKYSPQVTRYVAIDAMLRQFLKSGGGVQVQRA